MFVFSENKVQYIVRGKKPIEIPFDEISHHDVVCKHCLNTFSSFFALYFTNSREYDQKQENLSILTHLL